MAHGANVKTLPFSDEQYRKMERRRAAIQAKRAVLYDLLAKLDQNLHASDEVASGRCLFISGYLVEVSYEFNVIIVYVKPMKEKSWRSMEITTKCDPLTLCGTLLVGSEAFAGLRDAVCHVVRELGVRTPRNVNIAADFIVNRVETLVGMED